MLAVESFDPRLIWDAATKRFDMPDRDARHPRSLIQELVQKEANQALIGLDLYPDRGGTGGSLGSGDAGPQRRFEDSIVFASRPKGWRRARPRCISRRRYRDGIGDPAVGGSSAGDYRRRKCRQRPRTSWSTTRSLWVVRPEFREPTSPDWGRLISGRTSGLRLGQFEGAEARFRRAGDAAGGDRRMCRGVSSC